jgi:hypothetical protein
MEKKNDLQKVYVDAVDPHVETSADEVKVKVAGNLPNPSYNFERFDIAVKDDVIEITPLATQNAEKVVIQVLVPFERVCEVKNLKPGKYRIKVVGRGDEVVSKQQVEIAK